MEFKLFIAGVICFGAAMLLLTIRKIFKTERSQKIFKIIYSWVDTAWSSLIIASFIMFFFLQAFRIPSGSMRNTLLERDHLFVNKFIYGFHIPFTDGKRILPIKKIERGDIVIFECPPIGLSDEEIESKSKKDFIKRCVAIGGDSVEIKDKQLFVNGKRVKENYVVNGDEQVLKNFNIFSGENEYQDAWINGKFKELPPVFARDNFGPVIVPKGHFMMLGDNRDFSFDSRFWGPLPNKYIKGKALFLYWPARRWRLIK